MKERLLKRFSRWEEAGQASFEESDINALLESIRDDLEKIYNTRRGTVLIDEEFGLPDFSYMLNGYSAPDAGLILQQLLLQTKRYEPRLDALQVKYVEQKKYPGKLQFQLSARIKINDRELPFSINAYLSDDGSVSLTA
ncbi:MAG: type VI secretion system baseplate subunit TssE [Gammaproteobacteria bacterium]|nr:type VI secretion system baseplate subunit TssE [Gammaproteobacteria bacterium]